MVFTPQVLNYQDLRLEAVQSDPTPFLDQQQPESLNVFSLQEVIKLNVYQNSFASARQRQLRQNKKPADSNSSAGGNAEQYQSGLVETDRINDSTGSFDRVLPTFQNIPLDTSIDISRQQSSEVHTARDTYDSFFKPDIKRETGTREQSPTSKRELGHTSSMMSEISPMLKPRNLGSSKQCFVGTNAISLVDSLALERQATEGSYRKRKSGNPRRLNLKMLYDLNRHKVVGNAPLYAKPKMKSHRRSQTRQNPCYRQSSKGIASLNSVNNLEIGQGEICSSQGGSLTYFGKSKYEHVDSHESWKEVFERTLAQQDLQNNPDQTLKPFQQISEQKDSVTTELDLEDSKVQSRQYVILQTNESPKKVEVLTPPSKVRIKKSYLTRSKHSIPEKKQVNRLPLSFLRLQLKNKEKRQKSVNQNPKKVFSGFNSSRENSVGDTPRTFRKQDLIKTEVNSLTSSYRKDTFRNRHAQTEKSPSLTFKLKNKIKSKNTPRLQIDQVRLIGTFQSKQQIRPPARKVQKKDEKPQKQLVTDNDTDNTSKTLFASFDSSVEALKRPTSVSLLSQQPPSVTVSKQTKPGIILGE